ncbi:MAG TPA: aminotransferase class V-fold PLP-dependent enzyme [Acidobacteriota bacterium]|nr:aminotransferase class V-fold PLP-dependent enzyme [Acidobacteriota bacterium]
MIYLDHAATSWPKPPEVLRAMTAFLERSGGNPGRSGHRLSVEAGRIVYDTRETVAALFNAADPLKVIFTSNATHAVNLGLQGLLRAGDHVITSAIEHNSVMRPLRALQSRGVTVSVVPCAGDGAINPADIARAVTSSTRMVAVTHAGNVTGAIFPVADIAAVAHDAGALLLVDAAQTAGVVPIDVQAMDIDLLAFTGHKGLQGPPGTGGLVIGGRVHTAGMDPLLRGGTGSRSRFEIQPEDCPDKFESGTANGPGIAGLGAGIRWLMARGIDAIRDHEIELTRLLIRGLEEIQGVRVYGPRDTRQRTATVAFTAAGLRVSEIGLRLDEEFDIMCRVGLHCAPAAHRTIGTFPEGAVRLSPGVMTTKDEARAAIEAVAEICGSGA